MFKGFPIIDLHTHLRNDIPRHTKIARENGIDVIVYMANCNPFLDSLEKIKRSLKEKRYCKAIPVAAITKGLEGKELVKIDKIKHYVAGFSDDGRYLKNLNLLKEILEKGVLVLAHCSPSYEVGIKKPYLETNFVERYLNVLKKVDGKLHIQHISQKTTVDLIRGAKKSGIKLTCETCPHYFTYTKKDLSVKINPPLGEKEDILAIKEGLSDGTIDVIASDYAPLPRKTGIAGFRSFIPLSYGLVLEGVLSEKQLREKLYFNPQKIIEGGGYKLKL
ncbi:MAG: Dihydroorotase [Syntrophomonadaceae bacterium]|nr:Dihydroorotase [Bacillota bacterium]